MVYSFPPFLLLLWCSDFITADVQKKLKTKGIKFLKKHCPLYHVLMHEWNIHLGYTLHTTKLPNWKVCLVCICDIWLQSFLYSPESNSQECGEHCSYPLWVFTDHMFELDYLVIYNMQLVVNLSTMLHHERSTNAFKESSICSWISWLFLCPGVSIIMTNSLAREMWCAFLGFIIMLLINFNCILITSLILVILERQK